MDKETAGRRDKAMARAPESDPKGKPSSMTKPQKKKKKTGRPSSMDDVNLTISLNLSRDLSEVFKIPDFAAGRSSQQKRKLKDPDKGEESAAKKKLVTATPQDESQAAPKVKTKLWFLTREERLAKVIQDALGDNNNNKEEEEEKDDVKTAQKN
ncbi:uncharacterized protein LOC122264118 [Penaeus japonicus]|uniref:uncharacterized protein LOC122264118 n=1 Tax=Penaeus japonicus TaxID=27405 RepID=UPI001C714660|nr:uncharacterized protein LOC122264118 [Penaeus japonicus]